MSPARITARIDGVRELLRDLRDDPIYAKPWRGALEKGADIAAVGLRQWRPGKGNVLARTAVDRREVPLWSRARIPMRTRKGFRYLGALHGSKRIRYHYRSGPHGSSLTFGWIDKARDAVQSKIWPLLAEAEAKIERAWGRR